MTTRRILDKDWKIPELSEAVWRHTIFGYCKAEEAATLAAASQELGLLPEYQKASKLAVRKLLQHTAKGEEQEAEEMIAQNFTLILRKDTFVEEWCGQRQWTMPISALMYSAWCGDTVLMNIFLKNISQECKHAAFQQLKEVKLNGTEHGKHLAPVYKIREKYSEYGANYDKRDRTERSDHFIAGIGRAQLHSIVNLIQWYCVNTPIEKYRNFRRKNSYLPDITPTRSCTLLNNSTLNLGTDSPLGVTSALYKGYTNFGAELRSRCGFGGGALAKQGDTQYDSHFLWQFCEDRIEDLNRAISQLGQELGIQEEKNFCTIM